MLLTPPSRASGDARQRQPVFCFTPHRLSQTRRAESLRFTPLHLCRAYTLQGLQFLRCGCGVSAESAEPILSRQPEPLQSFRLHSVTQSPSAGPALTSEVCCRSTQNQPSVPEPEIPSSLASIVVPSGSCRACRLACSLSGRQKERCFRIALSVFRRVERWDIRTLQAQCIMEPHHTPEANIRIYI